MNQRSGAVSQSELDARKRREAREKKPVREWTAKERREAFREGREAARRKAEAGVLDEWDLCDECHEYRRERGAFWCCHCIDRGRQYAI